MFLLRPRERLRSIAMSASACLYACLSVRLDISGTTRATFTELFVHVAHVRGSASSGTLTIGRIAYRRKGGDRSAQRGRSVIYNCLVVLCILYSLISSFYSLCFTAMLHVSFIRATKYFFLTY